MVRQIRSRKASLKSSSKSTKETIKKPLKSGKKSVKDEDEESVSVAMSATDLNEEKKNPFADITNNSTNPRRKSSRLDKVTKKAVNFKIETKDLSPNKIKRERPKHKIMETDYDVGDHEEDSSGAYFTADDVTVCDNQDNTRRSIDEGAGDWRVIEAVDY
jgi:hypothetical protein